MIRSLRVYSFHEFYLHTERQGSFNKPLQAIGVCVLDTVKPGLMGTVERVFDLGNLFAVRFDGLPSNYPSVWVHPDSMEPVR